MAQYIIPTIFTATDRLTRPVIAMQNAVRGLGQAGAVASAGLNRVGNVLGEDVNNRLKFMISLGKSLAIAGVVTTAAKSILDYDTALTKFRVIVSDLNAVDFSKFKAKSTEIAKATRASSTEVVNMFTAIAGLDDRLASTPEKIGAVTRAAITMQRGGFMEADAAAKSLVTTLSQFGYAADQSDRVINAFAAGQNRGAFTINQTSEALVNFGATAKAANFQVEDAVGVLQALAASGIQAAEAGTALNAVILRVQASGRGYKSGRFSFIEGLKEMKQLSDRMNTRQRDAYITGAFGIHRYTEGRYLLEHIDQIERFTKAATGTKEAAIAERIAMSSLGQGLKDVASAFVTYVTTSKDGASITQKLAQGARFLTDNMTGILNTAVALTKVLVTLKAITIISAGVTWGYTKAVTAYNFVTGLATIATGRLSGAMLENVAAQKGVQIALAFTRIGLLGSTLAIGGVVTLLALLVKGYNNSYDATIRYAAENEKMKNGFVQISEPISRATLALNDYNNAVKDYNEYQNFKAYTAYEHSKGMFSGAANDLWNTFAHPIFKYRMENEKDFKTPYSVPDKKDFPGLKEDSTNRIEVIDTSMGQPTTANYHSDPVVNVYVNQDSQGKLTVTSNNGSVNPIPVRVMQTGGAPKTA